MSQGQLPLYYKNSKLVGPGSTRTKWSEYYLLVVTLFGFLMLFAGVLWFLPSIDGDDGYGKAYGGFTGTEPTRTGATGTESVVPPLSSSLKAIVPTFHSNLSSNRTVSQAAAAPVPDQVQVPGPVEEELSRPKSNSVEEHVEATGSRPAEEHESNKSDSPAETRAREQNNMRRDKVVQVCWVLTLIKVATHSLDPPL